MDKSILLGALQIIHGSVINQFYSLVASPKFKTVPKTTELLTLNSQNLYEEEPIYGGSDDQSH